MYLITTVSNLIEVYADHQGRWRHPRARSPAFSFPGPGGQSRAHLQKKEVEEGESGGIEDARKSGEFL